jgi:hypothetical protein
MVGYARQLIDALRSDPLIDEIGLLLDITPPAVKVADGDSDAAKNDDVSITVVMDHKLGIAAWALKPIFLHSMPMFMELLATLRKIQPGFLTIDSIRNDQIAAIVDKAIGLSSAILIVKGDIPIVHNFRKELLEAGALDFEAELLFLSMLFTRHPKSPSAWEHRRWCLRRMNINHAHIKEGENNRNSAYPYPRSSWAADAPPLLSAGSVAAEAELCRLSAEAYPRNYYAWMHRLWLLPHMSDEQVGAVRWTVFDGRLIYFVL